MGTLYSVDEIAALVEVAHRHGMKVHLDGARIANAAAALGGDVRPFTVDVGRRRAHLRRHQERDDVRRGGRLPRPRARAHGRSSCASRPASCRRRCATSAPSSRRCSPTTSGWPTPATPTPWPSGWPTGSEAIPGVELQRAPEVNSVFVTVPPAALAAAAGLVVLLGVGPGHHRGAVDDELRHHAPTTSRRSPTGWPYSSMNTPASDQASSMRSSDSMADARSRSATPATSALSSASAPR